MTGLAANAHPDQLVAFGTSFRLASEFQLGSGTINHFSLFEMTTPQGFVEYLGF
jgi:hypothetical protein